MARCRWAPAPSALPSDLLPFPAIAAVAKIPALCLWASRPAAFIQPSDAQANKRPTHLHYKTLPFISHLSHGILIFLRIPISFHYWHRSLSFCLISFSRFLFSFSSQTCANCTSLTLIRRRPTLRQVVFFAYDQIILGVIANAIKRAILYCS